MKVVQYIRVNHYFRNVAFVSSVLLFILVTLLCLPISSGEQDTLAATNQGDSITINFTNNTALVDLSVNNADGTFATSSTEDKAAFSISTDNASGYTLSISSNDDTGELTSGTSSFTSIDSAISSTTFDNSSYNGKWGYLPSKYNSTDNTNYLPSPTTDISILDITSSANATANDYTIALGARADYSNTVGNYSKTFTLISIANIIPESCNNSKLCIEYDANGLYYINPNTTMDRVNYNSTTTQEGMTKYSHTPNVSDEGVASGAYANNLDTTDTVTIPGATTMEVTIYYDTQSTSYDWVSVYQSPFTITDTNDSSASTVTGNLSGKLAGIKSGSTTNYSTWYSETYTVTGDTVKFHFKSNASYVYHGYYAVITGTSTTYTRSVYSGSYIAPTASSAQTFRGWSTTQVAEGTGRESDVEYLDETAVMASIPGSEGGTKTLYAVWQQAYPVTITKDENVSSVTILDSSGNTVSTITESNQSVPLYLGDTYTINPTYNTRYAPNTFEKTSGEGTFTMNSGYKGTLVVGAGSATINITSQYVDTPMQNYNCANLSNVGDTKYLYDSRDNEVYLIGKLADNKCWFLDDLRLDLANSATLASLTTSNTNATETSLTSLRSGNRAAGNQYATAGFATWDSSSTSNPYNQAKANSADKDTVVTSYGSGSGKVGVYYNYCAASAGSYCYNSGAAPEGTNATQDICPKGWRMPTGGSTGEYQALYTAYNSDDTNYRNALSTPLSGDFYSGSARNQSTDGYFWSSTRSSGSSMYFLNVSSSNVDSQNGRARIYGHSVRCLLMSTNTYTLNYDKNTTDTVSNMPSSQSATVQNDTIANFTLPTNSIPSRSGYVFAGWGTSSDQAEPTYKYNNGTFTPSEATVYANDNPETLYAIWYIPREITFNIDSNVSSVQILDSSGNVASTVTTTGTNVNLMEPATYTIKPTHTTNYTTDTIAKTSGVGTLNDKEFTVGAGTGTITITSREIPILYDEIAALSKGKNTDSNSHFSWTEITTPTSTAADSTEDTSTSGVFEWDGMTAGNGIDSNGGSQKIYFYRGILETDPGTYGSRGSANAYPNYVKLANNTCWRIVRTTSTGGIKIIYSGTWHNIVGSDSTCAAITIGDTRLTTSGFNHTSATVAGTTYNGLQYQNIHAVGYTYSSLAAGTESATPISTVFGSTGNDTTTNTNSSIIKQYIEDWYKNNMTDYTSKLEGDAGYCNDRTLNEGTSWTTPLADNAEIIPYGTTGLTRYRFGSRIRNANLKSTFSPTLTCPRGKVDLYSYINNAGNGNGQLAYPVALLTADEASLAGSGHSNSWNAYNAKSYIRTGSAFWLLSPYDRNADGYADGFQVGSSMGFAYFPTTSVCDVRPVISLAPGTRVLGSGTATDPWVVQ